MAEITLRLIWYKLGEVGAKMAEAGKSMYMGIDFEDCTLDFLLMGWCTLCIATVLGTNALIAAFGPLQKQPRDRMRAAQEDEAQSDTLPLETAHWFNNVVNWCYLHYYHHPEFLDQWVKSLNDQVAKLGGPVQVRIDKIQSASLPPKITELSSEASPKDRVIIHAKLETRDLGFVVFASQQTHEGVKLTNVNANVLRLKGTLRVVSFIQGHDIKVSVNFEGHPEIKIQVKPLNPYHEPDELVDLGVVESVVRHALKLAKTTFTVTHLLMPGNLQQPVKDQGPDGGPKGGPNAGQAGPGHHAAPGSHIPQAKPASSPAPGPQQRPAAQQHQHVQHAAVPPTQTAHIPQTQQLVHQAVQQSSELPFQQIIHMPVKAMQQSAQPVQQSVEPVQNSVQPVQHSVQPMQQSVLPVHFVTPTKSEPQLEAFPASAPSVTPAPLVAEAIPVDEIIESPLNHISVQQEPMQSISMTNTQQLSRDLLQQQIDQVPRRDQQRVRPQHRPEGIFEPVEAFNLQTSLHSAPPKPPRMVGDKRLLVKIIKANGLSVKEIGAANSVCMVSTDEPVQGYATSTVKNTAHPFWDEHFLFDITRETQEVRVEVYDKAKPQGDEFIGESIVYIEDLRKTPSSRQILRLHPQPGNFEYNSGSVTAEFLFMDPSEADLLLDSMTTTSNTQLSPRRRIEVARSVAPGGTLVTKTTTTTEKPLYGRQDPGLDGSPNYIEKNVYAEQSPALYHSSPSNVSSGFRPQSIPTIDAPVDDIGEGSYPYPADQAFNQPQPIALKA